MANVKKVGKDTYEVNAFLQSMPDVTCKVTFIGNDGRIVERTGYTSDKTWDQRAVQAVQSHLIFNTVS